jgi:hypothetical protein
MTSRPAAHATTTLVEARHPVDPIGRTVTVREPVENAAMAQAVPLAVVPERDPERAQAGARGEPQAREEPQARADRNVMIGVLIVVLVAGRTVRASVVARC